MAIATKYPEIDRLPDNAMRVKAYADLKGWAVGYVYVKFERSLINSNTVVNYKIVQFQGINFIVPD